MVIKTRAWLHTLQDVYAHRISENLLLLHTPQPCESNAEGCWDAFGLRVAQWGIQNSSKLTVRQALSQFMGFDWFQMISDDFRCQLSCGPNDCATQRFERIAGASRTGFFISGRSHRCVSVCVCVRTLEAFLQPALIHWQLNTVAAHQELRHSC